MRITVLKKHSDEILREYNENVPGNRISGTAEPGIKRGERGKNHGKSDVSGQSKCADRGTSLYSAVQSQNHCHQIRRKRNGG
jgi:hypothetical protein